MVEELKIASQKQFSQRIGEQSVDDSFPRDDQMIAWLEVAGVIGGTDPVDAWSEGRYQVLRRSH